ncbi:MAG TPA: type 2 isopentenyl-diphosphate Delta-isomerase [Ktedonobacteraceae bacterium]
MTDEVKQRKAEHVRVALQQDLAAPQSAGWHDVRLLHQALPEVDLDAIDTSVSFLGHTLKYPLLISAMTGGHPDALAINRNLALAAQRYGLALGVGSQRAGIVNPEVADSYTITRETAPDAFLIANVGAPQLIAQERATAFTLEQIQRAIAMIEANALAIHMNSLQEAAQPEGDRRAVGEADALSTLSKQLDLPLIAKETGAGINREQAQLLRACGVAAIDVGGAGGTSMAAMEAVRSAERGDTRTRSIGQLYRDWGIPTPISLVEARSSHLPLIATGGLRSGLDIARSLALGATLAGMAFPFLQAASAGFEAVCELIEGLILELKVAMQLSGAANISQMRQADVIVSGETYHWLRLRGFEETLTTLARHNHERTA